MNKTPLFFVLCDGIDHSVFAGQVVAPLLDRLRGNPGQQIVVVSFEKKQPAKKLLEHYQSLHANLSVIILKRLPFAGTMSLYPAIRQLKHLVGRYAQYSIIARGPLAGYITLQSIASDRCDSLIVQARGLLAEEYAFAHQVAKKRGIKKMFHQWRHRALYQIEQFVYAHAGVAIEAVSRALADYLVRTYCALRKNITLANKDVPPEIPSEQLQQWRVQMRTCLGVDDSVHVYCYSGSIKEWQCPQQVIAFFKAQFAKQNNIFLLVLTHDKKAYEHALLDAGIDRGLFCVETVTYDAIYRYLAACDTGIVFRKEHILSLVSRPVKVMEYRAARLDVVHNGSVAWLNELYPKERQQFISE